MMTATPTRADAPVSAEPAKVPDQRAAAEQAAAASSWALVQRVQAGDTEAFGEIYDRYRDGIFRFIYFRCGSLQQLAEDLTHDTFLRALRRIGTYTWQGRDFGAWLVTIARNLVADHYKSGRYRLEVTTGDVLDADTSDEAVGDDPPTRALASEAGKVLQQAMRELTELQRTALEYRFLDGLSVGETALKMDMEEGAVKALTYRAVRALARDPRLAELAPRAAA